MNLNGGKIFKILKTSQILEMKLEMPDAGTMMMAMRGTFLSQYISQCRQPASHVFALVP
jgi:hypothetical protein